MMKSNSGLTVAIQAGGASTRMGRDKSFVHYQGRPMIEIVRNKVQGLGDELLIVTNNLEPYTYLDIPLYLDTYPGFGPLAGLHTALKAASQPHILTVACDMPNLNQDLLQHMISLKETADVIVPRWENFPEPLHAIYSKTCLPFIERDLQAQKLKTIGFYADVTVRYVDREEIQQFDPLGLSFTNINTPNDLK